MIESTPVTRNYGYDAYEPGTLDFRQGVASSVQTGPGFFGADGLDFWDVLDAINPFQHLPIVGAIYRSLTGDQISPGARLAGGALFGGPLGFAAAVVDAAAEEASGRDLGGRALAWALDDESQGGRGGPALPAADGQAPEGLPPAAASPGPQPAPQPQPVVAAPTWPPVAPPTTAASARRAAQPQLSPQAFQALMQSVSREPAPAPPMEPEVPELSASQFDALLRGFGGGSAPEPAAGHSAAMELHDILRRQAQRSDGAR